MPYKLSVEQEGLRAVAKALKDHEDGKALRKELAKNLRAALDPAVGEIKRGAMSIASRGHEGRSLRSVVARKIKAQARLSGRSTGARIHVGRTPEIRGFAHAPKRLNSDGWRHPVFGTDTWVEQEGNPNYFDDPVERHRDEMHDAVLEAMENTARQIAKKGR